MNIEILEKQIVIVLDVSQYIKVYSEEVPFKAKIKDIFDDTVVVRSIRTNREYELYAHQILECFSNTELKNLINLDKYGK